MVLLQTSIASAFSVEENNSTIWTPRSRERRGVSCRRGYGTETTSSNNMRVNVFPERVPFDIKIVVDVHGFLIDKKTFRLSSDTLRIKANVWSEFTVRVRRKLAVLEATVSANGYEKKFKTLKLTPFQKLEVSITYGSVFWYVGYTNSYCEAMMTTTTTTPRTTTTTPRTTTTTRRTTTTTTTTPRTTTTTTPRTTTTTPRTTTTTLQTTTADLRLRSMNVSSLHSTKEGKVILK